MIIIPNLPDDCGQKKKKKNESRKEKHFWIFSDENLLPPNLISVEPSGTL